MSDTGANPTGTAHGFGRALVAVYAVFALATDRRRLATAAIGFELVGVLTVGVLSLVDGSLFPDQTVWSDFGAGYVFIPLVLPFVGLWWLQSTRGHAKAPRTHTTRGRNH